MRKQKLEQIIALSPVPVKFLSQTEIKKAIQRHMPLTDIESKYGFSGLYLSFDDEPFIVIWKKKSNLKIAATLLHEIGHATCDKKNCKCFTCKSCDEDDAEVLSEVHADEFALKKCIEINLIDVLRIRFNKISNWDSDYKVQYKASKILMKKPIWKRCKKILDILDIYAKKMGKYRKEKYEIW